MDFIEIFQMYVNQRRFTVDTSSIGYNLPGKQIYTQTVIVKFFLSLNSIENVNVSFFLRACQHDD